MEERSPTLGLANCPPESTLPRAEGVSMSEPGPQPTEERANNLLVKAESSFSSGLMDEAVRLYHECSRMFMRLASAAEEKPRMALFLAKASYCDFMKAY